MLTTKQRRKAYIEVYESISLRRYENGICFNLRRMTSLGDDLEIEWFPEFWFVWGDQSGYVDYYCKKNEIDSTRLTILSFCITLCDDKEFQKSIKC